MQAERGLVVQDEEIKKILLKFKTLHLWSQKQIHPKQQAQATKVQRKMKELRMTKWERSKKK